jgi:hypothetical protein
VAKEIVELGKSGTALTATFASLSFKVIAYNARNRLLMGNLFREAMALHVLRERCNRRALEYIA